MGMNTNKNKGPIAEINVTPLVDVMLVLLVIFMISAPLMFSGIALKLPETKKVNRLNLKKNFKILSINKENQLYFDKKNIKLQNLELEARMFFRSDQEETLYIRADEDVKYGFVAKVMARLKAIGIRNISLVTDPTLIKNGQK